MLKHFNSLRLKLSKPNIKSDPLLRMIDSTPYYQPISPELLHEREGLRYKYLTWRNNQAARCYSDRNKFLNLRDKNVLDIGCNIGYFGWSNAHRIRTYIGIDSDNICINIAKNILDISNCQNLNFICSDAVQFIEKVNEHFDVCLFLSIYHHLLYQVGIQAARRVINLISRHCDILYFDMGQKNEPSNPSRQRWHDLLPDEPPEPYITLEVLGNTLFNRAELLGETIVGNSPRLFFRFTKTI